MIQWRVYEDFVSFLFDFKFSLRIVRYDKEVYIRIGIVVKRC